MNRGLEVFPPGVSLTTSADIFERIRCGSGRSSLLNDTRSAVVNEQWEVAAYRNRVKFGVRFSYQNKIQIDVKFSNTHPFLT